MMIGERLRQLRERRDMSQGDIERTTGLLRCYTSRVENGHTVPSVETLQKYSKALGIEMWELFAEHASNLKVYPLPQEPPARNGARILRPFTHLIPKCSPRDRKILLFMARAMTRRNAA
jgi:transcriptional regulator with XRE-family HTH domain